MEKIYIVTGAFGHLGINLCKRLLEENIKVVAFDMNTNEDFFNNENLSVVKGNICNVTDLDSLFSNLSNYEIIVIHCAGIVSIASKYDQRVYNVNVNRNKKHY